MNIIKQGRLRADKTLYTDGIGCSVWYPFNENNDEVGVCFDFSYEDINDFILLLQKLIEIEPDIYEDFEEMK
jgi:hypothetical protein